MFVKFPEHDVFTSWTRLKFTLYTARITSIRLPHNSARSVQREIFLAPMCFTPVYSYYTKVVGRKVSRLRETSTYALHVPHAFNGAERAALRKFLPRVKTRGSSKSGRERAQYIRGIILSCGSTWKQMDLPQGRGEEEEPPPKINYHNLSKRNL